MDTTELGAGYNPVPDEKDIKLFKITCATSGVSVFYVRAENHEEAKSFLKKESYSDEEIIEQKIEEILSIEEE